MTGIWEGLVWALSGVYAFWAAILRGLARAATGTAAWTGRGLLSIACQPLKAAIRLRNHLIQTPMEVALVSGNRQCIFLGQALYGLLICLALVWLYRQGAFSFLGRKLRLAARRAAFRLAAAALNLVAFAPFSLLSSHPSHPFACRRSGF